jgi:hypothetical protein
MPLGLVKVHNLLPSLASGFPYLLEEILNRASLALEQTRSHDVQLTPDICPD